MSDDLKKFSDLFRDMADRIERNKPEDFAGAILIVPPTGDAIAVMIADPTKDLEAFWAVAQSKIQIATAEYMGTKSGNSGVFQRR